MKKIIFIVSLSAAISISAKDLKGKNDFVGQLYFYQGGDAGNVIILCPSGRFYTGHSRGMSIQHGNWDLRDDQIMVASSHQCQYQCEGSTGHIITEERENDGLFCISPLTLKTCVAEKPSNEILVSKKIVQHWQGVSTICTAQNNSETCLKGKVYAGYKPFRPTKLSTEAKKYCEDPNFPPKTLKAIPAGRF